MMLSGWAGASGLTLDSGPARVHLVELFSSEGCSSCPPAEQWLGGLRGEPGLWRDFVPVAFHVTYWDRLGWRDRFAAREYTERQYRYASAWGAGSVYTPCFVLDGREWRARGIPRRGEAAGQLVLEIAAGRCHVTYTPAETTGGDEIYEVHYALLGTDLTSAVRAGENAGRTLHHDFVVLSLGSASLRQGGGEFSLNRDLPPEVHRQAVAAWVTSAGEWEPLQAVGGWLD